MSPPRYKKNATTGGGWVIPEFGPITGRTAIRPNDANDLVKALNALGRMEIKRGSKDSIVFSDYNVRIQIKEDAVSSTTADTIIHPFQIYRAGDATSWLDFKVRTGYVITTAEPIIPTGIETTISATSGDTEYWIYLNVTATTAAVAHNGTTQTWGVNKIPIGWIDASNTGDQIAVIHQFTHDNVFVPCAS